MASSAFSVAACAPVQLNSTVLPVQDLSFDPGIAVDLFRAGQSRFGAALLKLSAQPVITFRTPLYMAWNLLGFGLTPLTALSAHLTKFSTLQRASGSVHRRWALRSGATAAAWIQSAEWEQKGVVLATVAAIPLCPDDGTSAPLIPDDTSAIPTLSSLVLHTNGPLSHGGARISGLRRMGYESGIQLEAEAHDGDTYLRAVAELAADPKLTGTHHDPVALLTSLGLFGGAIGANPTVAYLREIDNTTGAAKATGLAISCASGGVHPGQIQVSPLRSAELGVIVQPIASGDTHPFALTSGTSIPA